MGGGGGGGTRVLVDYSLICVCWGGGDAHTVMVSPFLMSVSGCKFPYDFLATIQFHFAKAAEFYGLPSFLVCCWCIVSSE